MTTSSTSTDSPLENSEDAADVAVQHTSKQALQGEHINCHRAVIPGHTAMFTSTEKKSTTSATATHESQEETTASSETKDLTH